MTPAALPLTFGTEVAEARAAGRPIVALESTIITHGMPFPANLETARQVEAAVREAGAVPATIAVIAGRLHVGLDAAELEALAAARDVAKLSRADLAVCLATGGTGSTTVAATMIAAHAAGIAVFATGDATTYVPADVGTTCDTFHRSPPSKTAVGVCTMARGSMRSTRTPLAAGAD